VMMFSSSETAKMSTT